MKILLAKSNKCMTKLRGPSNSTKTRLRRGRSLKQISKGKEKSKMESRRISSWKKAVRDEKNRADPIKSSR